MGLDRVAIKLADTGLAAQYQCYSIFPVKTSPKLIMKHLCSYNSPRLSSISIKLARMIYQLANMIYLFCKLDISN